MCARQIATGETPTYWHLGGALTLATLLICSLQAVASGTLQTDVVVIEVKDQHGTECDVPLADFCFFQVQNRSSYGDLYVDAYQRIEYVGLATDFSAAREAAGEAWLLEDQSVMVRGEDIYLPLPAMRVLTESWQRVPQLNQDNWVYMEPNWINVSHTGPGTSNPSGAWKTANHSFTYGSDGFDYDRIGPYNAPTGRDTDADVVAIPLLCFMQEISEPCHEKLDPLVPAYQNNTPNVRWGLEFYSFEVATDPDNLTHGVGPAAVEATLEPSSVRSVGNASDAAESLVWKPAPSRPESEAGVPLPPISSPLRPPGAEPQVAIQQQAGRPPPPADLPVPLILGATAAGILLVVMGAGLYSRFHGRSDVLKSDTRDRLINLVQQNPGISLTEAAAAMDLTPNAVRHHVHMLVRVQVVRVESQGRRKMLFLVGSKPASAFPNWLLRNAVCMVIVRALQASPEGMPREAVHGLLPDVPGRTRNHNIRRLVAAGVLEQVDTPAGAILRVASVHAGSV